MKISLFFSFFLMSFSLLIAQPVADFTSDITTGCGNTIVTFTNNSTNFTSLELDFDDGTPVITSFAGDVSHMFRPDIGQAGNYTVTLTVHNGAQNDVDNITITIHNKPTAVIIADTTKGCAGLQVNFNATSSSPGDGPSITEYKWAFGDGNGYTGITPPIHGFPYKQTPYQVSLEVSDVYCSSIEFKDISVSLPPNISIAALPSEHGCGTPYDVDLYNSITNFTPISSYDWDFGDGDTGNGENVNHTYNALGTYDVTLTLVDENYCSNTFTSVGFISVEDVSAAFSVDPILCAGSPISFQSTSTGAVNFLWKFGNGDSSMFENPLYTYSEEGNRRISLIIDNGNVCVDSVSYDVFVQDISAGFEMDTSWACQFLAPIPVSFTDTSTGDITSWNWDFGDGGTSTMQNPSHSFTEQNDIKLVVESDEGCKDSINQAFALLRPIVNILQDTAQGCIPLAISFIDSSEAISTITNRFWDFGDGNTFNSPTVDTAYNLFLNADTFYTKLTITDDNCGDQTDSVMILVGDMAVVDFTFDNPSCAFGLIQFTDNSTPADSISEWFWSFGDTISTPVEEQNPLYNYYQDTVVEVFNGVCDWWEPYFTYTAPQTLWVKLTVGYNGCYTTDSSELTLKGPIVVYDTLIHNCSNPLDYRVALDTLMQATKVKVDFFSNTGGTDISVTKYYDSLVSLRDTIDITLLEDEYRLRITAYDTISNCQHEIFLHEWTGLESCSLSPQDNKTIICTNSPVTADFTFSPDTVCAYENVTFDASASSANATSYQWFVRAVGDTTLLNLTTTTDSITSLAPYIAGEYDVVLVASACDQCTDTVVVSGLVSYQPSAVFALSDSTICAPDTITININSTNSDIPITDFLWSFDNGVTESKTNSTFVKPGYITQGTYFPKLTLTDSYGCISSDSIELLASRANPFFSIANQNSRICPPGHGNNVAMFTNNDLFQDYYKWDFGDGSAIDSSIIPSTTSNPKLKAYASSGLYDIVLTSSVKGCLDSSKHTLEVMEMPNLGFEANKTLIECWGDASTIIFTDTTSYINTFVRRWDFGPYATTYLTDTSATYAYNDGPGTFNVSLSIRQTAVPFCIDNTTTNAYITVGGAKASYFVADSVCRNDIISFSHNGESTNGPIVKSWDFGDGLTSDAASTTHSYKEGGTYIATMFYDDGISCVKSYEETIVVNSLKADFVNLNLMCGAPNFMVLNNQSTNHDPALSQWTTPFKNVTEEHYSDTIDAVGSYDITLTVYDAGLNCVDDTTKTVNVFPIPTADIHIADTIICYGDQTAVSTPFNANYSYEWIPSGAMDDNTLYNPNASPMQDGEIIVNVTDNSSTCTNSDTAYIYLQEIPEIDISYYFPRNDSTYILDGDIVSIPIGDTVQLIASSTQDSVTFIWEDNPALSCFNCINPFTSPDDDIIVTVVANDSLECNYDDASRTINVHVIPPRIVMPTAFTPNSMGNTQNEVYKVMGPGIRKLIEFKVYNRWGELVFSTDDINQGWDGTYNGKKQNIDTYVYYVKAESVKGKVIEKKGAFSLIR